MEERWSVEIPRGESILTYSVEVCLLGAIEFVVALMVGNLLHHTVRACGVSVMHSMSAACACYMVPLRA